MAKQKVEKRPWSTKVSRFGRISSKERIAFFKYLGIMTESGVPLEKSLMAIHAQARTQTMHNALHLMLNDVSSGEFLSSSMEKMPQLFDKLTIQLVAVGEESGTLTQSFIRISEYLEKSRDVRGKIQSALLYPLIVVGGTLTISSYMIFVLLPQLRPLFTSLKVTLPWTTAMLFAFSDFITGYGLWVLLAGILLVVLLFFLHRIESVRYVLDAAALHLPVIGNLMKRAQISQFSRIISTLIKSGITIDESFKIASLALDNRVYQRALSNIAGSFQQGQSVSDYLLNSQALFPPFVSQMVSVGEETGRLDESFRYLADFSEREVDDATKTLTTVLEPAMMIFVGLLVGFIAISIITPIYQLTQGIQAR